MAESMRVVELEGELLLLRTQRLTVSSTGVKASAGAGPGDESEESDYLRCVEPSWKGWV